MGYEVGVPRLSGQQASRRSTSRLDRERVDQPGWHHLRYQDTQAIRQRLLQGVSERTGRPLSPASVNKALAALRGVLREAWHGVARSAGMGVAMRAANLVAGLVLAALACGASGASEPSVAASDRIAGFSLE